MKTMFRTIAVLLLLVELTLPMGAQSRRRPSSHRSGADVVEIISRQAGSVESQMPDKMYDRVRVLIVEGPINGKDLAFIKKVANRNKVINEAGKGVDNYLELDLENARIERSGGLFSSNSSTRDEIPTSAFSNCDHLLSVVLPSRVTAIGDRAFYDCDKLEVLVMGQRVARVGESAFEGCDHLKYLTMSGAVETLGDKCFANCTVLSNFDVPRYLRSIGKECFKNVPITDFNMPVTVSHIGENAFAGTMLRSFIIPTEAQIVNDNPGSMSKLTEYIVDRGNAYYSAYQGLLYDTEQRTLLSCPPAYRGKVTVPSGVTAIAAYAFNKCTGVTAIDVPSTVRTLGAYGLAGTRITSFVLPASMTVVPAHLFDGCTNLRSVTLHDDVTAIENYAFANCNSLLAVDLPLDLTSLGDHAFYRCTSLQQMAVPGGVTTIAQSTFHDCSAMMSISLPQRLTSIGKEAFRNCNTLRSLVVPPSVLTIEKEAFRDCKSLATIDLSGRLSSIGDNALRNTALTELTLPAGVTHVGKKITEKCDKLQRINVLASTPPTLDKVNNNKVPLYVPSQSLTLYKSAKNWKNFKNVGTLD